MHDTGSPRKEKLETGSLPSKIFLSSSREKILGYGKRMTVLYYEINRFLA